MKIKYDLYNVALLNRLLLLHAGEHPLWNVRAAGDFCYLLIMGVVSRIIPSGKFKNLYGYAAHIGFLLWIWRELSWLDNGQGYVTMVWGFYAMLLLVIGLRTNRQALRHAGIATLFVVVGKLFIIDLAELEMIWRILLFLGFGGLLLLLSYFFQALWKKDQG